MQYIEEFRNVKHAKGLASAIQKAVDPKRYYKIMEFCGGHTHTIHRYGITSLLPGNIELVHGPGCPVCVLPIVRIDQAIHLAKYPDIILCSYGDMLRIPGSKGVSLLSAKASGADIRMIYTVDDALRTATKNLKKKVIFFAIGFETTTPPTAIAIKQAKEAGLKNFYVFCNHILTPPALEYLLSSQQNHLGVENQLDGFIGPAHVSIIIGSQPYQKIARKFSKPIVISGFEPLDVLHSILLLIQLIHKNQKSVEIQYTRAVNIMGNIKSQRLMEDVFKLRDSFEWRGLGEIPNSALQINAPYHNFDAENHFQLPDTAELEHKGCQCGSILRGHMKPSECALFASSCTPDNPLGSCMASTEGACAAYYAYARHTKNTST